MGKTVSAFRVAYQRKIISIWENIRHYPQIKESRGTGQISASPGYSFCSVKCRWWDSNPHTLADNRFWVCLVCQFRHTGIYIFKSYPGWSLWEIGGPSWGDIKNHLHIELSNFFEKSRASAEVVTTDEWDFESVTSANSIIPAKLSQLCPGLFGCPLRP